MSPNIVINGREVTNPFSRALIVGLGFLLVVGVIGLVVVLVLGVGVWLLVLGLVAGLVGAVAGLVARIRGRVSESRGSRALGDAHTRDTQASDSNGDPLEPDEWRRG